MTHEILSTQKVEGICALVWQGHFRQPLDSMPGFDPRKSNSLHNVIRKEFFSSEWHSCFDILEVIAKRMNERQFSDSINRCLERECSIFRLVENEFVPITDANEINAIEVGIAGSPPSSSNHLSRALEKLSDRKNPDYANSIKESISAVESVCREIVGGEKATLGEALKILKEHAPIHPGFEKAMSAMYGFTSDAGGIRHSKVNGDLDPTFEDAKYLLVVCSAFVNFVLARRAKSPTQDKSSQL